MQFGNPIGFEFRRTVTSGIISAKNRTIKIEEESKSSYMTDLIQTDATINPGNSGGPLIYPNGDIIGINTVKISTAEGIGFAIPINIIRPIIESFKQIGNFEEATIGIYAYDKEVVPYLNTNLNNNFQKGIYVAQITRWSSR
ncbi:MAG: S1C family serine protease [Clostridia bacterium]